MIFHYGRTYDADDARDVRDWKRWVTSLRQGPPNGALRPIIGPRRFGKTWALQALERALPDAQYIQLRDDPTLFHAAPDDLRYLLLDEPGELIAEDPRAFLDRCNQHRKRKGPRGDLRVVVAMTPREWGLLRAADPRETRAQRKDRWVIPPLSEEQASLLARGVDWARDLLPRLEAGWRRSPFLLELILQIAEDHPALRADVGRLMREAVDHAAHGDIRYVAQVFDDGLADEHRAVLRAVAWGDPARAGAPEAAELLAETALTVERGPDARIGDPVLADHLPPPVRIHHVSDVHFGKYAAAVVDDKDKASAGRAIAGALGGGASAAASYASWVAALCEKNRGPHLLLVTGDLAEWALPAEFEAARDWLDSLRERLRTQRHRDLRDDEPRVLLTGGNHDVDWKAAASDAEPGARHQAFASAFDGYPHPHLEKAPKQRPAAVYQYPDAGVEIALLGSSELGGELDQDDDTRALRALVARLHDRARDAFDKNDLDRYAALRDRVEQLDPALVHHEDLRRLEHHPWRHPVRLALIHHPVSPVPGSLEVKRYGPLVNAAQVKHTLLRAGVSLVLHGHEHRAWVGYERWPGRHHNRGLYIASAPSLGSAQVASERGFHEIRVRREGGATYEVEIQPYTQQGTSWQPDGEKVRFLVGG